MHALANYVHSFYSVRHFATCIADGSFFLLEIFYCIKYSVIALILIKRIKL